MKRWQNANGKRHALEALYQPPPGETFRALCGAVLTTAVEDYPQFVGKRLFPTCVECHRAWCKAEHIALPGHG